MPIPRIIHYCWMSEDQFPPEIEECIKSWKRKMPSYELKLWSSKNFDFNLNKYTAEAMKCKKYAFVSDFVRLYVLYNNGGIYLDSDVMAIKNFDSLLNESAFIGYESGGRLGPWLIASEKKNPIIKELLDYYNGKSFYKENGEMDLLPNTVPVTNILVEHGLLPDNCIQKLDGITILPEDYFCPKNPWNGKINITNNTIAMHLFMGMWNDTAKKDLSFISLIDQLVSKCVSMLARNGDKQIIVYGMGVVGRNVLDEIKKYKDISVKKIIVTRRDNNWKSINGISIVEIRDSDEHDKELSVLVATIPKYYTEIENALIENGFKHIYFLRG